MRLALRRAAKSGVVVVQSSPAPHDEMPMQEFLDAADVLAGGDRAPQKLRILLMLALSGTSDRSHIQRWIDEA
ncbi:L-asparaginase [Caballeronia catudaia]|uniref:L-asparaginase n=1 Tax=Caballeronia catudaia TaxID=1777136 RepID=A0A158CIA5_9BURK|nr:hypothetical protein [Caballeronia catudaia]SAK82012.1 L-asparaginase [Caballeronia catudaia]